ncbi:MAG: globin domain-containing protein, partial [Marinicella sp.]
IKATYPILKEQGVKVTKKMYEILFTEYPECEELFKSAKNQPEKLANSILAFVGHIDEIEQLATTLENIAKKHVAAEVKAIHYPMVADALITAMREVIGPPVFSSQVSDAWVEAYMFLASHLMAVESDLYHVRYKQSTHVKTG